ncbi:LysE family translocator [Jannaschia sp. W003]|uniref:LysE family translocator n=1 Tax=Jannaschia sp. W003 TaxID=2867012 RepID=UPI0021A57EDE|nr:LysE family transporter [Jannaschia sp. W003]UWQ22350.1 LysE family transporter [Jannaschia sp. W003]
MTFHDWLIFAGFWAVFVTSPGPNAANCILAGWSAGLPRALWCVAAILTQASAFLALAATGAGALLAAAPEAFAAVRLAGAAVLVGFGVLAWVRAGRAVEPPPPGGRLYLRALAIATFNAKSLAGYLAAFTQFVRTDVAMAAQMTWIAPTALTLTALSYTGWTALGAWLGRRALGVVASLWLRRALAACLVAYGVALALL